MNRPVRWAKYSSSAWQASCRARSRRCGSMAHILRLFLNCPRVMSIPHCVCIVGHSCSNQSLPCAQPASRAAATARLSASDTFRCSLPGDYQLTDKALTVYLHPQPESHVGAMMVMLPLGSGRVKDVLSPLDGSSLFPLFLEPELLSGVRGESRQMREWVPLAQIPPAIVETILTIEDRRFYSHFGIDPVAVGRALWTNVTKGGVVQGGSTITQQLAKNLFYSPQRTMGENSRRRWPRWSWR